MATVHDMMVNLNLLDVKKEIRIAIERNLKTMLTMNQAQLYAGKDTKGGTFAKYVWHDYAWMKNEMNPIPGEGNPDLKLTGSFYRGFYATIMSGSIFMNSTDAKAEELQAKYGGDNGDLLFGLNDDNQELFGEFTEHDFQVAVEAHMGLKFKS